MHSAGTENMMGPPLPFSFAGAAAGGGLRLRLRLAVPRRLLSNLPSVAAPTAAAAARSSVQAFWQHPPGQGPGGQGVCHFPVEPTEANLLSGSGIKFLVGPDLAFFWASSTEAEGTAG